MILYLFLVLLCQYNNQNVINLQYSDLFPEYFLCLSLEKTFVITETTLRDHGLVVRSSIRGLGLLGPFHINTLLCDFLHLIVWRNIIFCFRFCFSSYMEFAHLFNKINIDFILVDHNFWWNRLISVSLFDVILYI